NPCREQLGDTEREVDVRYLQRPTCSVQHQPTDHGVTEGGAEAEKQRPGERHLRPRTRKLTKPWKRRRREMQGFRVASDKNSSKRWLSSG
ncbi:unnamed protein product, partial [Amoebophrya sp. A120]